MSFQTSTKDVFINCPFDGKYSPLFRALIFTVYACGRFRARSTREVDDGGEARIEKLYSIIKQCRYGIHDLSRTQLDKSTKLPRFNMPLELGIFLGCKKFGGVAQAKKRTLILDTKPYRYQKFISDIAGMDIHAHGNSAERAVAEHGIGSQNVSERHIPGAATIVSQYREFQRKLPSYAKSLKLDYRKLSYSDYERLVTGWLSR